nr:hypothetical protein [uncultured bacterium]
MTSKTALFALLAMWGVGSCLDAPAIAEDASTETMADQTPLKRSFTNRVWVKADSNDELPGVMKIFLSDGTLVQDSCWETHRLSNWTMSGDTDLSWNEDGMDIPATIVSVTSTELHLQLTLGTDTVSERYVAATVPYTCPDMPK